jgi:hypothetical protein
LEKKNVTMPIKTRLLKIKRLLPKAWTNEPPRQVDEHPKKNGLKFKDKIVDLEKVTTSDVEAEVEAPEAEAPEAVALWWKQKWKHLKIFHFRFRSVSKLLFKFW